MWGGMWGEGMADKNYAEFQAKLLGGPPQYDPVEEHMRNVIRTAGWWLLLDVLIGGAVLWLWDLVPAAVAIAIVTIGALCLLRRVLRVRAAGVRGPDATVGA